MQVNNKIKKNNLTGIPMNMVNDKILVTKTFLPPLSEVNEYLEKIWNKRWLTNCGPVSTELENKLKERFGVKHVFFVTNGTVAMQLAMKALDVDGEVITTPFTFAATTNAILWEKCKPVFVDIDPNTFCIDAEKIEVAITANTKAILAVHVFGYPCNVRAIEKIAKKHNLKVIYDAAHAFDLNIGGKSIFNYGDISTLSLHATKLFHTGEGGLIVTNDDKLAKRIASLRNFGYIGEEIAEAGINAKNSEIHASLGLVNLKHISMIKGNREKIVNEYKKLLNGTGLHNVTYFKDVEYNSSYFPVVFDSEKQLLAVFDRLSKENIIPRRYFYPSLNTLPFVEYMSCPVSESIASRVACLPLYHDLSLKDVKRIVKIITTTIIENKVAVSVGIPAYNESNNVEKLIKNILAQKAEDFYIKEIIVNSDGSSDSTVKKVKAVAKSDSRVRIIEGISRKGKTSRLNEIHRVFKGDYLLTIDADVLLSKRNIIQNLLNVFNQNPKKVVVAANLVPLEPKGFLERIIYTNDLLWNMVRNEIIGGDHIANLYGSATMLKANFAKKITYPANISCDEEYLYLKAKEVNGFAYAKDAVVFFKAPETINDILRQGKRYLNERNLLREIFNIDIDEVHVVPRRIKLKATMRMFFKTPVFSVLALGLNIFLRAYPYVDELNKKGMWEKATSTKILSWEGNNND